MRWSLQRRAGPWRPCMPTARHRRCSRPCRGARRQPATAQPSVKPTGHPRLKHIHARPDVYWHVFDAHRRRQGDAKSCPRTVGGINAHMEGIRERPWLAACPTARTTWHLRRSGSISTNYECIHNTPIDSPTRRSHQHHSVDCLSSIDSRKVIRSQLAAAIPPPLTPMALFSSLISSIVNVG